MSRESIVASALEEVGNTDASRYWLRVLDPPQADPRDGKGKRLAWCGACALYIIQQGGHALDVKWIPGRGYVAPKRLKTTSHPKIGDTAYRKKGQHYATVVDVGDGWVSTVDGNSSETVAGGRLVTGVVVLHELTPTCKWDAFYDIEPLLT